MSSPRTRRVSVSRGESPLPKSGYPVSRQRDCLAIIIPVIKRPEEGKYSRERSPLRRHQTDIFFSMEEVRLVSLSDVTIVPEKISDMSAPDYSRWISHD